MFFKLLYHKTDRGIVLTIKTKGKTVRDILMSAIWYISAGSSGLIHPFMVLATSKDNKVTARTIIVANDHLKLYFFTWDHSRKCLDIENKGAFKEKWGNY